MKGLAKTSQSSPVGPISIQPASSFADLVASHRALLLRVARRTLIDGAAAEDAVSETLIAALAKPTAFAGQSSLATWLIAILKRKCIDHIRRQAREPQWRAPVHGSDHAVPASWVNTFGNHATAPDPMDGVARLQFLSQLEVLLAALPRKQGLAFVLRYGMDKDLQEVCRELDVSPNHASVMLHRARRQLRKALDSSWSDKVPAMLAGHASGLRAASHAWSATVTS